MYPVEGNERAIGLDYREHREQRGDVLRAVRTGEIVLAGPVDLVQGGRAFIGRFPVFTGPEGEGRTVWGLLSAVIDVDELFEDSGVLAGDLPIDIAIASVDPLGRGSSVFMGSAATFADAPVVATIALPSVTWQVAAVPLGGQRQGGLGGLRGRGPSDACEQGAGGGGLLGENAQRRHLVECFEDAELALSRRPLIA